MPTNIGIGFSNDANVETAAKNAAFNSKTDLKSDRVDFAFIFSSIHYDPQKTLPIIQRVLNNTKIIGCSTAGIILSDSIETHGISVLTISSDEMNFGIGSVKNVNAQGIIKSGALLGKNTLDNFNQKRRQIFMFFVDGHIENNSLLLKGIQEVLGNVFPIVGGGSCDDFHFTNSFQIYEDQIFHAGAVGLIMGGQINVGVGGRHGWKPLGKPRMITDVAGHIIKTIDGKKASDIYKEYFQEEANAVGSSQLGKMSILYPLGIYVEGSNEYLLRNAVDILDDGSIVCQGEVPEESEVHIMIGNKDFCEQAAVLAAQEAHKNLMGKQPKLILIIESMARLKLLGRSAIKEIRKIKEIFGPNVPLMGMYSHGEICPFQSVEKIRKPYLQNESMVVLAIA